MNNGIFLTFSQSIPKHLLCELFNSSQRIRKFDPLKVLQLFIYQIIYNCSCRSALSSFALSHEDLSLNTGAYSRAKKRLPEDLLKTIALRAGDKQETPLWKGRIVKLVDGTTLQMEDTVLNQKEYPQNPKQVIGLGQPILRALFVFSHKTGRICDLEVAPYMGKGTAEPSLLRKMLNRFDKGDILVMDRFFTGMREDLESRELDYLIRARDRGASKRFKGNQKEIKLDSRTRLIKYKSQMNGFRDKIFYFMTNLSKNYSSEEIADLYFKRWNAELGLRDLKRTLGSFFLRSKSPEMVRKELYVRVLVFNLTRSFMDYSKTQFKKSFKLGKDILRQLMYSNLKREYWETAVKIFSKVNWFSPFRQEPRVIKRRSKGTYGYMMKPRAVLKAQGSIR
jgi:hypothetical protein